jgi:hypothetical protein
MVYFIIFNSKFSFQTALFSAFLVSFNLLIITLKILQYYNGRFPMDAIRKKVFLFYTQNWI